MKNCQTPQHEAALQCLDVSLAESLRYDHSKEDQQRCADFQDAAEYAVRPTRKSGLDPSEA